MADTVSVTSRVPKDIRDRLDKLAEQTERSRAWHISKALELYLEEEEPNIAAILEGIQADDAGEIVSGEEVGRMLEERIAASIAAEIAGNKVA